MSKKYYDRVLTGSGVRTEKFHSSFGASILKKFGWAEGEGLGKDRAGITDCIQIKRRKDNVGLGAETVSKTEWTNWWDDLYNTTANNVQLQASSSSSSSDSEGEEALQRTHESLLEICGGRTCKRGNVQTGKLKRIQEAEARVAKHSKIRSRSNMDSADITNVTCLDVSRKRKASSSPVEPSETDAKEASAKQETTKGKKEKRRCVSCHAKIHKHQEYCSACSETGSESTAASLTVPETQNSHRKKKRRRD